MMSGMIRIVQRWRCLFPGCLSPEGMRSRRSPDYCVLHSDAVVDFNFGDEYESFR